MAYSLRLAAVFTFHDSRLPIHDMNERNKSLDALRGFAILAMVLSSSIAFGILPAWMYHAQTPPPAHAFDPRLPGITWVDLVFPFFLFSMGAAIPLALRKKVKEGKGTGAVLYTALRRYAGLVFFALFTVHVRSGMISAEPAVGDYLLSILSFVLLCFQWYSPAGTKHTTRWMIIKAMAFLGAGCLLFALPFKDGKGFSLYRSDIIIIVLANMALFGTITWWFTQNKPWVRIGILPFVMAIILGAKAPGSWNEMVLQWSPAGWMYKFYYLKYLFIIIPGTLAGDWLVAAASLQKAGQPAVPAATVKIIAAISVVIIAANVILLFGRHTTIDLLLTVCCCAACYFILHQIHHQQPSLEHRFFTAGAYLLLLGLFFEAWEGGIKKDPSTFSYYFVTAGLAFFMLLAFQGLQLTGVGRRLVDYFSYNGKNPMVAYVAGNLLLLPLLHLSGGYALYTGMQKNITGGVLSGLLFTGIVSVITVVFTKKGWQWKT
jgi:predicted acyltransferase